MANYPQELAQDAVCQSHTGHMTGLWFQPTRPLRLNTNERMNDTLPIYFMILYNTRGMSHLKIILCEIFVTWVITFSRC